MLEVIDNRSKICVDKWPECEEGKYDPRCCRFPKSCSCTVGLGDLMAIADVDIKDFARRVERLCDFFLSKKGKDLELYELDNYKVIENIKELAADIQFDRVNINSTALTGLYDYMNGAI